MSPRAAVLGAMVAALAAASRLFAATGFVFDDRNGDGLRGAGEPGIASVAVSNGVDVTLTDPSGFYRLPDRAGQRVFVIKPRGWCPPLGADNVARLGAPAAGASGELNFPLRPRHEPVELRVLVLTDPQPSSEAEAGYLERGLLARLGRRPDVALGVTLGDIVYDRPDLFGRVNALLGGVGVPWYSVPGNHDKALGTPDEGASVAAFESVYGPSTYAFHAGPALFVALDDVRPLGGPRFIGGLRPDQFEFLSNVLKTSPRDEWLVLIVHIPLFLPYPDSPETFRAPDRMRLFGMLRERVHVLILSGHTHYQRHVEHGPADGWTGAAPLHEYNVAAACGGFWGGPPGPDGVPVSTMADGTPPGYALLGFNGGSVSMDYFPALLQADHQLEVHAPAAVAHHQGYVSFFANVFNGDDQWAVEARIDSRAWLPMARTLGWDPSYADAYLAQDRAARPLAGPRLPPPVVCYHLWRGTLPADLAVGAHVLQVRARAPGGGQYVSERTVDIVRP
jgi:3',5'-cyclic AMP phosphodiesterase CpdA